MLQGNIYYLNSIGRHWNSCSLSFSLCLSNLLCIANLIFLCIIFGVELFFTSFHILSFALSVQCWALFTFITRYFYMMRTIHLDATVDTGIFIENYAQPICKKFYNIAFCSFILQLPWNIRKCCEHCSLVFFLLFFHCMLSWLLHIDFFFFSRSIFRFRVWLSCIHSGYSIRFDLILFYIFIIHWCAILHTSNYLQTQMQWLQYPARSTAAQPLDCVTLHWICVWW